MFFVLKVRLSKQRRGVSAALMVLMGVVLGMSHVAKAGGPEPILYLGIQRHTAIDKMATEQLRMHLAERGENLLKVTQLNDAERRCRHPQCLEALASDNHAMW